MSEHLLGEVDALDGRGGSTIEPRDVVRVTGPDTARYLQGQLSQDVVAMADASTWTFVLEPSGRVDAWFRVHRSSDDEYLLEIEAGWGDALLARMRRFLLRTKTEFGDVEQRWLVRRRWSPSIVRIAEAPAGALAAPAIGPGEAGIDLLFEFEADAVANAVDRVSDAAGERHRIAHGIVRMGRELTDATIPAEAGQWVIDRSVSFTKGCYTGQELVARIDSRGAAVPRPVRLLSCAEADLEPGDLLVDDAVTLTITSAVPRLDQRPSLALAIVPRSIEPERVVRAADGIAVLVTDPPASA